MKIRITVALVACVVSFGFAGANAQTRESIALGPQWSGREITDDVWRIYNEEYHDVAILVYADRRTGIPFAEAFEQTKQERAKIDKCPALANAETKPEYELFAAAMAALKKIDDDPANDVPENSLPIIGYETVDSVANPRCALIARELAGGTMLYTVVIHMKGEVIENFYRIPEKSRDLMKLLNERATAALAKDSAATSENEPIECVGTVMYDDWVMSWSPKLGTLYVRNPEFLNAGAVGDQKVRFGVTVRTKFDSKGQPIETTNNIYIAARDGDNDYVPKKEFLMVDGRVVQRWGTGFEQWAGPTAEAMSALDTGKTAEMATQELGRIRFKLKNFDLLLPLLNTNQQIAALTDKLGKCAE